MGKKITFSLVFTFLLVFITQGDVFHLNLFADEVCLVEKEVLKRHIITSEMLRECQGEASNRRVENIEKIEKILDYEDAQKYLSKWGFEINQVKTVVRTLSNSELENLANQSEKIKTNFFGGDEEEDKGYLIAIAGVVIAILILALIEDKL